MQPAWSRDKTEILWDEWGIPHIFATQETDLFRGFGWAQARGHADLLLTLYGQARGRAAEYWGLDFLDSDQYVHAMNIPQRGQQWYEAQSPQMQRNLTAFVDGINDYFQQHPAVGEAPLRQVLPIRPVDVVSHVQSVLMFQFVVSPRLIASLQTQPSPPDNVAMASNAWAIAPEKSQSGNALLLASPHLPWGGMFRWTEMQLKAPGINFTGASLVGMPVPQMGFNNDLGWSLTVNAPHNVGQYGLALAEGGYRWQGQVRPFTRRTETIKVRQPDNTLQTLTWDVLESEAGTVVTQREDTAYVLDIPGLERAGLIAQFWQMGRAHNLAEFEAAWQSQQVPLFNVLYGDRQGNIFYLFNTLTRQRDGSWQEWGKVQPLEDPDALNQPYYSYDQLPKLKNPENGWLQNSNDPPWTSTFPMALSPQDYSPNIAAPSLAATPSLLRTQRSIKLLKDLDRISLADFQALVLRTDLELAERIVPLLVSAAKVLANPIGLEAATVLEQWDKQANADSRGAVLFLLWATAIGTDNVLGGGWRAEDPLNSPSGMKDINKFMAVLEGAAAQVEFLYGDLAVSWGEVVRMQAGQTQLPAHGAPSNLGSFRVLTLRSDDQQKFQAIAGESYLSVMEFGEQPQAQTILVYGNSSQPDSPHNGDQLNLYANNQWRPAWRSRPEIEAHLEKRDVL